MTDTEGDAVARPPRPGRIVISSVTGRPIPWDDPDEGTPVRDQPPLFPSRVAEDSPEPDTDESNDARLTADRPPHWGNGA